MALLPALQLYILHGVSGCLKYLSEAEPLLSYSTLICAIVWSGPPSDRIAVFLIKEHRHRY